MKILFTYIACLLLFSAIGQTTLTRSYPVKPGEQVSLDFDYPKIVRISTWDKNEVQVKAMVSINEGANDTAFVLDQTNTNGIISVKNRIIDFNKLPHIYSVMKNGVKTKFRSKEDYQKFIDTGEPVTYSSNGVDLEITIDVKVPISIMTNVKSTYGIVELVDFNAPVTITAPYGGIDATINEAKIGKLTATTSYGQIYTNLDLVLTDKTQKDFFTSITAEPGKGPSYIFKSTYGKIYLRKP